MRARGGNRTHDVLITSETLCRLRYTGVQSGYRTSACNQFQQILRISTKSVELVEIWKISFLLGLPGFSRPWWMEPWEWGLAQLLQPSY